MVTAIDLTAKNLIPSNAFDTIDSIEAGLGKY